jgi:hypothetical protein
MPFQTRILKQYNEARMRHAIELDVRTVKIQSAYTFAVKEVHEGYSFQSAMDNATEKRRMEIFGQTKVGLEFVAHESYHRQANSAWRFGQFNPMHHSWFIFHMQILQKWDALEKAHMMVDFYEQVALERKNRKKQRAARKLKGWERKMLMSQEYRNDSDEA